MPSNETQAGGNARAPDVIRPGPDVEEPIDLGVNVRVQKAKLPTQGVRYEARMDLLLAEYRSDNTSEGCRHGSRATFASGAQSSGRHSPTPSTGE
jgi:hypothetical protein